MTVPKFPDVDVRLTGVDGNAFAVIAAVTKALRKAGVDRAEINEFTSEATAGDYNHLLRTCMTWVNVL